MGTSFLLYHREFFFVLKSLKSGGFALVCRTTGAGMYVYHFLFAIGVLCILAILLMYRRYENQKWL